MEPESESRILELNEQIAAANLSMVPRGSGDVRSRSRHEAPDGPISVISDMDLLSQELSEAGGNAMPVSSGDPRIAMFQQKNLYQQLNQVNLCQVSFNHELFEQVAEERHRNILNEHLAQTQKVAEQRDELYNMGIAMRDEMLQMTEANQSLVQEMRSQRFRSNESIDFLEKAANDQINLLRRERDLEMNEARKTVGIDQAKDLEISLLRDQVSRQSQDTELLKRELRRSSDFQEQIMAELSSLRASREDKTELLKTVELPSRPGGPADDYSPELIPGDQRASFWGTGPHTLFRSSMQNSSIPQDPPGLAAPFTGVPPNNGGDPPPNGGNPLNGQEKRDRDSKQPTQQKKASGGGGGPPDDDDDDDDEEDESDDDGEGDDGKLLAVLKKLLSKKGKDKETTKSKEADHIKLPPFPQPENYRNWKIKVRDAIMAASRFPDKTFNWVNKVWEEGRKVEDLADTEKYVTLDAKLLSALSNIAVGELARKIDTFKEKESLNNRPVRGRQVLLMFHEFFSTNIKHGATYRLDDLFAVQMKGDNLRTFMSNWEMITAGVPTEQLPSDQVLETLFYRQVKNSKKISHDLEEYKRAPEGSTIKSYSYLVKAVHRFLNDERFESNRERIAANLGASKPSTPAVGEKGQYIPKGYCIAWNKGGCNKDSCTYKHEKPPKRERTPSRGRSKSVDKKKKDPSKIPCKYWKIGRCKRGSACDFSHEGPQKTRSATPARQSSKGSDKAKKKRKEKKGRKGSRERSNSSKGSRKSGSGGSGKSKSPSPAAVCLIASMLASVAQGFPCQATGNGLPNFACPAVRFNEKPDITTFKADGILDPYVVKRKDPKTIYPIDFSFPSSKEAVEDAILTAKMLGGAVRNESNGFPAKCDYKCDNPFGCDHCIPKYICATPAESSKQVTHHMVTEEDWIADTGSAQDLMNRCDLPDSFQFYSNRPISIITANGESSSYLQGKVFNPTLGSNFKPYLLESTPPVISVGMRCMDEGFDFIWRAGCNPYFKKPDGERIVLSVKDYVPYVPASDPKPKPFASFRKRSAGSSIREFSAVPASSSSSASKKPSPDESTKESPKDSTSSTSTVLPSGDDVGMMDVREEASRKAEPTTETSELLRDDDYVDAHDEGSLPAKGSGRGTALLKAEAKSRAHLLTHIPKNPFCEVCNKAKMTKPPSYSQDGSKQVKSEKFGDHISCDFLVTGDYDERGIDDEKVALVVKDIATKFIYVYPSGRKDAESAILAMKHFVGPGDKVEVVYSDNAPELINAIKTLQWRHVLSKAYLSQSNAVIERSLRTVLDGTRVNLLQSGLNHSYWPYAARHFCAMGNVLPIDIGMKSPWELRFDEKFPTEGIPFGCYVDFWNGPKKRPKDELRFEPTTTPGVFLGFVLHPGCLWRNEYYVATLKSLREASLGETVRIYRVPKLNVSEPIHFPLRDFRTMTLDDKGAPKEDELPPLENQDADLEYTPSIAPADVEAGGKTSSEFSTGAGAVWHDGWLAFLNYVDGREGWYEYAGCQVKYELLTATFVDPRETINITEFPFRTTVVQADQLSWHVIEENARIEPWHRDYGLLKDDMCKTASIFSSSPIELRVREAVDEKLPEDDEIQVINYKTGRKELIKRNDPTFYCADGFKTRRYKGSSKPEDIPSFVLQSLSPKQRRLAIEKEQKKIAAKKAESSAPKAESSRPSKAAAASTPGGDAEPDVPAMPVIAQVKRKGHRDRLMSFTCTKSDSGVITMVARPVGSKEIRSNPKAQKALDVEWDKLIAKNAWLYDTVREWSQIASKAKKEGKKVHIGKVFEICVEKGSELPENDPLRKFKGRTVFQGNNVRDENSDVALFAELGSSPATMEAGKVVDAFGAQPGHCTEQADGKQAYTQSLMEGTETWVEIPRNRWPKGWEGKYTRPAMLLRIALYGHPDSGGLWERHCEKMLFIVGFIMPDPLNWPSMFYHPDLKLLLIVYVDDFKMSGPIDNVRKGWELIGQKIDLDNPGKVGRYLGCDHIFQQDVRLSHQHHPFAHTFDKTLPDPAAKKAAAASYRTQDYWEYLPSVDVYARHHVQPRKAYFKPNEEIVQECLLSGRRCTEILPSSSEGDAIEVWDEMTTPSTTHKSTSMWVGTTYLFTTQCHDPIKAMATIKRDKQAAKKIARSENFAYLDQLNPNQPCMTKTVTVVRYDMKPFLKSCVDRYTQLAGKHAKPLKAAATPFHEERIARPSLEETEPKGVLAPIAARVLMKILFAARMARFDLLRAVQGLAARVTKWSVDCDKALYRLVCYINSTLDLQLQSFIGDSIIDCRLWLFADADHAGEYDNRSTSGCFLVLVGPNTYFPLTAFSKKQTSVSMSSTESEVVSANVSLRSVGLPSSGLWLHLQKAGGVQKSLPKQPSMPGGLPSRFVSTESGKKSDYWTYDPSRRLLCRIHRTPRNRRFTPTSEKDCPIPIGRIGLARTTLFCNAEGVDLSQDNWRKRGEHPEPGNWTGRTLFRVYGPHENDYQIESQEIREAFTDWEFVGQEKEGSMMISMFTNESIQGVFVEDNQATIRILETGKSPAFRHTDKTQRVNLSWLEEQFKRKWYQLVHGPSLMQSADILTKPFTSSDKWNHAVRLLGIRPIDTSPKCTKATSAVAEMPCTGGPVAESEPQRLLIEVCCDPQSKLSNKTRAASRGCEVLQFTRDNDLNKPANRRKMAREIKSFLRTHPVSAVLIWASLPCTGGTPWSFVNLKNPVARRKVLAHIKEFDKLWKSFVEFLEMIDPDIPLAIEWPRGCIYWRLRKVIKVIEERNLTMYNFDGCAFGIVSLDGAPIKKPWTVATGNAILGNALAAHCCACSVEHAQGRGESLKRTESYSFKMTDLIHRSFAKSSQAAASRALVCTRASSRSTMAPPIEQIISKVEETDYRTVKDRVREWEMLGIRTRAAAICSTFYDYERPLQGYGHTNANIGSILEVTAGQSNNAFAYMHFGDLMRRLPEALLLDVPCPPEGEADVIIAGDSSIALVDNQTGREMCYTAADFVNKERLPWLKNITSAMRWGKGLKEVVLEARDKLLDLIAAQDAANTERPILVAVGWAGNDVYGDYGYSGCSWINQRKYLRTEADRKVAAEWPAKQRQKVQEGLDALLDLKAHERVLDVVLIGNACHLDYNLPQTYQREMTLWYHEASKLNIQSIDCTSMTMYVDKVDDVHMAATETSKKVVSQFYTAALEFHYLHLKY